MALPKAALGFPPESFGSKVVCLGTQVALLAEELDRLAGPLEWWVADVETNAGHPPRALGVQGTDFVGSSTEFSEWAKNVGQFVRGVFMAVRPGASRASLRTGPQSEDDPWTEMGDELFDIRAFDTSSLDVVASDPAAAAKLAQRFGGMSYPRPDE
jgi:hypothetical protein